jgi:hypothetical protein
VLAQAHAQAAADLVDEFDASSLAASQQPAFMGIFLS